MNTTDLWDSYPSDEEYDADEFMLSPLARHTEIGWRHIQKLCAKEMHIGFGALDSFLSGPDLERRIELVEKECQSNKWLSLELRDTLGSKQSNGWIDDQYQRLHRAAFDSHDVIARRL